MKILITGATGFIGSNLLKLLIKDKNNVIYALTRRKIKDSANVKWIKEDFLSITDLNKLPKGIECIIHLAQSRDYKNFPEKACEIFSVNSYSTLKLLDYGRKCKIKYFILASSGGVTGYKNSPIYEKDPLNPTNFYLNSKCISESLSKFYSDYFSVTVLRYYFVYGEGQRQDAFIPFLINRIKNKLPVYVYGKEEGIKVNPIYIEDAVKATLNSIVLKGRNIINIGGKEPVSIVKICNIIAGYLKVQPIFERKNAIQQDLICDIQNMKHLLNVEPGTPIKEGIKNTIYFKENK